MSDSEDDIPLSKRLPAQTATISKPVASVLVPQVSNIVPKPAGLGVGKEFRDASNTGLASASSDQRHQPEAAPSSNGLAPSVAPPSSRPEGSAARPQENGEAHLPTQPLDRRVDNGGAGPSQAKPVSNGAAGKLEHEKATKDAHKAEGLKPAPAEEPSGRPKVQGSGASVAVISKHSEKTAAVAAKPTGVHHASKHSSDEHDRKPKAVGGAAAAPPKPKPLADPTRPKPPVGVKPADRPKPSADPARPKPPVGVRAEDRPKVPSGDAGGRGTVPGGAAAQANGVVQGVKATKKRVLESDSEDDMPLGARIQQAAKRPALASPRPPVKEKVVEKVKKRKEREDAVRPKKKPKPAERSTPRRAEGKQQSKETSEIKWQTLVHNGVLFPPEYQPHGVKMLYEGRPVDLTPAQEEVASLFAVMKETDYMKKPQFLKNFWAAFRQVLGKNHMIHSLDKCDFTPIYEWQMAQRDAKKSLSKEEKQQAKAEKDEAEAKYKFALVDGRKEQVGNFRVEPPGLFRGRGEHPKMGMLKRRIYPRDITINIGKDAPTPEHPYEGQDWKEVRHDNSVTWLAFWKDPISEKDYKYVWLAANSTFKSDSDLAKYEKARRLKDFIGKIREDYEREWNSKSVKTKQMAVALYFLDKLALRAGHEKDEDEADTVGCCTLKVENVECIEPDHIKFDFLGKDSIRYENTVQVHRQVFSLVKQFCERDESNKKKRPEDQLFDTMDASDLNKKLKDLMDGLSVKVFRTYNASITLDDLLSKHSSSRSVDEKKADYDRANKEVAILCNHQRSVPKGHAGQMEKMEAKLLELQSDLNDLESELEAAEKGKPYRRAGETPSKKVSDPEAVLKKIEKKKEQLAKHELQAKVKEDLKTVALGTSKINYLDPRITVAWCKLHEVPMEKIFNKSLLSKFHWAMDVEPEFRF